MERTEIETVLADKTLIEQGCFNFDNRIFI